MPGRRQERRVVLGQLLPVAAVDVGEQPGSSRRLRRRERSRSAPAAPTRSGDRAAPAASGAPPRSRSIAFDEGGVVAADDRARRILALACRRLLGSVIGHVAAILSQAVPGLGPAPVSAGTECGLRRRPDLRVVVTGQRLQQGACPRAQPGQRLHDDVAACRARAALDDLLQHRQASRARRPGRGGRSRRSRGAATGRRPGTPFEVVGRRQSPPPSCVSAWAKQNLLRESPSRRTRRRSRIEAARWPRAGRGPRQRCTDRRALALQRLDALCETLVARRWAGSRGARSCRLASSRPRAAPRDRRRPPVPAVADVLPPACRAPPRTRAAAASPPMPAAARHGTPAGRRPAVLACSSQAPPVKAITSGRRMRTFRSCDSAHATAASPSVSVAAAPMHADPCERVGAGAPAPRPAGAAGEGRRRRHERRRRRALWRVGGRQRRDGGDGGGSAAACAGAGAVAGVGRAGGNARPMAATGRWPSVRPGSARRSARAPVGAGRWRAGRRQT